MHGRTGQTDGHITDMHISTNSEFQRNSFKHSEEWMPMKERRTLTRVFGERARWAGARWKKEKDNWGTPTRPRFSARAVRRTREADSLTFSNIARKFQGTTFPAMLWSTVTCECRNYICSMKHSAFARLKYPSEVLHANKLPYLWSRRLSNCLVLIRIFGIR